MKKQKYRKIYSVVNNQKSESYNKGKNVSSSEKYHNFTRRQENSKHRRKLTPPHDSKRMEFDRLLTKTFRSHIAAYNQYDVSDQSEPALAKRFYNDYYIQPNLEKSGYGKISIDDFIEEVFLDTDKAHKNKFSFLLGNVGVGKTAFINYLISSRLHDYRVNLIFVRVDFEYIPRDKKINIKNVGEYIMEKFAKIITENFNDIKETYDYSAFKNATSYEDKKIRFYFLIKRLNENKKKKLILIIDNLDIIYHWAKQDLFCEDDIKLTEDIDSLLRQFTPNTDGYFDSLNANLLVVMRNDTYE